MSFQIKLDPCPIPGKGPGFYLQGPYVTDSFHSKIHDYGERLRSEYN